MLKEFKDFISKGNVMDMAIGVVVGGAFQKIVNSLVNDIIMPFTSIFTGKINFSSLTLDFGNVSIKYGSFITEIINFLILAFSVFIAIRTVIKLNEKLESVASDALDKNKILKRTVSSEKEEDLSEKKLEEEIEEETDKRA